MTCSHCGVETDGRATRKGLPLCGECFSDRTAEELDVHLCPVPRVGAGHSKPPRGWQEGMTYACGCGRLHALQNRWNYAGDWWEWQPVAASLGH